MSGEKEVTRRNYIKYAGAGIVVVAGAAAGAYYSIRPPTETTTATTGPKLGGEVNYGLGEAPRSFDPVLAGSEGEYYDLYTAYERLLRYDEKMNLAPELAERWEASPDGKEYTFYLRKGVKFHNGKDFTAEDVKFSFDRLNKMKEQSVAGLFFAKLDHSEVLDTYTVKIVNSEPWAPFLNAMPLHSASILPALTEEVDWNNTMIGTAPFKFVERVQGQYEKFEKNADYWGGKPLLDNLWFRRVVDPTARAMAFESKQFDCMQGFGAKDAERLQQNTDLTIAKTQSQMWMCLEMQHNSASHIFSPNPSKNEKVNSDRPRKLRQALNYAIDREEIAKVVYEGWAIPTYTGLPPEYLGYYSPPGLEHNVDKAKQLLSEAGYPNGLQGVKLATYADFNFPQMAELLKAQCEKSGIGLDVQVQDLGLFEQTMGDGTADITLDCNVLKLDPALTVTPYPAWVLNYKEGTDATFDQIAKDTTTIMDKDQRAAALKRLQEYVFAENMWLIAVVFIDYVAGWWNTLHGVKISSPPLLLKFDETWKE